MTAPVLTITLNPTIDVFGAAAAVRPTHKVRLKNASYEPGGGGINVARVITALGGTAEALFLAGGEMGAFLGRLIAEEGVGALIATHNLELARSMHRVVQLEAGKLVEV